MWPPCNIRVLFQFQQLYPIRGILEIQVVSRNLISSHANTIHCHRLARVACFTGGFEDRHIRRHATTAPMKWPESKRQGSLSTSSPNTSPETSVQARKCRMESLYVI